MSTISEKDLSSAQSLYDNAQTIQAYKVLAPYGDPVATKGTKARILMGQIALDLGAPRLGASLLYRAYRNDRTDPLAILYYLRTVNAQRGSLAAWELLPRLEPLMNAPSEVGVEWLSMKATLAASLGDFVTAQQWLSKALGQAPENPWAYTARASVLEMAEEYESALESARQTLSIRPLHYPAIITTARILRRCDRLPEALTILQDAEPRMECPQLALMTAEILKVLGQPNEAIEAIDRYEAQALLLEPEQRSQLNALRAGIADVAGEGAEAQLTSLALPAIAEYDVDLTEQLAGIEETLAKFPGNANALLTRLSLLRELGREHEYRQSLETICCGSIPVNGENAAEVLQIARIKLAELLLERATEHRRALSLLRLSIRKRPPTAAILHSMAVIQRQASAQGKAESLFRLAACQDDSDSATAASYLQAARLLNRSEAVLQLLRDRFKRSGDRSGAPAQILYEALKTSAKLQEADDVLAEAIRRRPNDGDLILFAAEQRADAGDFENAHKLLDNARALAPITAWHRAAARIAIARRDRPAAISAWERLLESQPLAIDVHVALTNMLAGLYGPEAAIYHLEQTAKRFPNHPGIHRLWAEWLRDHGRSADREIVLRSLVSISPSDPWAWLELADALTLKGKFEEAQQACDTAAILHPGNGRRFSASGDLLAAQGRWTEAGLSYRTAFRLSASDVYVIGGVLEAEASRDEKREALAYLVSEVKAQSISYDGLEALRHAAATLLDPQELMAMLQSIVLARPDAWQTWSVTIRQFTALGRNEDAIAMAREAVKRFPHQEQLSLDLAEAHQSCGEYDDECDALRQALNVQPECHIAARRLADSLAILGEIREAITEITRTVERRAPDADWHRQLSDLLWSQGRRDESFTHARTAATLQTEFGPAWAGFLRRAQTLRRTAEATRLIDTMLDAAPLDAGLWLINARIADTVEAQLAILDAATTALNKQSGTSVNSKIQNYRAEILTDAGRFKEALAACNGDDPEATTALRGRAAWVLARQAAAGDDGKTIGDQEPAIERIRLLLEEVPRYYEGWAWLSEWTRRAGHPQDAQEAAMHMVALRPSEALGYALLGQAELDLGDRENGKAALGRATEMANAEPWMIVAAVDEYVQDFYRSRLDGPYIHRGNPLDIGRARAIVRRCGTIVAGGGLRESLEVQIASAMKDERAIRSWLTALCELPESGSYLEQAIAHVKQAGMEHVGEYTLRKFVVMESPVPRLAAIWAELDASQPASRVYASIPKLPRDAAIAAGIAYLRYLTDHPHVPSISGFVNDNAIFLKSNTALWFAAGGALLAGGLSSDAAKWLSDWKQHEDVTPKILLCYVDALRNLGGHSEARRIGRHALTLDPDDCTILHEMWLALDAALDEDLAPAVSVVYRVEGRFPPRYRFLFHSLSALAAVTDDLLPDRAEALRSVQDSMLEAEPYMENDPLLQEIYAEVITCVTNRISTAQAQVWRMQTQIKAIL